MNKKNPWSISEADAFKAGIEQFCNEAGGTMRMYLIRYNDAPLLEAVERCDPLAITLAASIGHSLDGMDKGTHDCLICHADFAPREAPHAFIIWLPASKTEHPLAHGTVVTQPICEDCCAQSDRDILNHALLNLKSIVSCDVIEGTEDFLDEL